MAAVPQLIFFHIGWMKRYGGPVDDDRTIGPHKHLQDNRFGHECFNFFPRGGKYYGYVPSGIDISNNLGASRSARFVDDIVCVWLAKDPERNVRVIVGWYRDARVFRSSDHRAKPSGNELDRHDIEYLAVAAETDCTLAHDYRFNNGCWSDADGTTLEIQERTGAVCQSKDS